MNPYQEEEDEFDADAIDAEGVDEIEQYALGGLEKDMAGRFGKTLPGDEANAVETPGVEAELGAEGGEEEELKALLASIPPEELAALMASLKG